MVITQCCVQAQIVGLAHQVDRKFHLTINQFKEHHLGHPLIKIVLITCSLHNQWLVGHPLIQLMLDMDSIRLQQPMRPMGHTPQPWVRSSALTMDNQHQMLVGRKDHKMVFNGCSTKEQDQDLLTYVREVMLHLPPTIWRTDQLYCKLLVFE